MHLTMNASTGARDAIAFALNERRHCVSDREWRFRLKGYGYDVRETGAGRVLTTVTGGIDIGALDA